MQLLARILSEGNRSPRMVLKSSPLVSVVTPVYNNAEYLPECIESILAQTYQNWDYTIVNNCSTDGSGEIARRYAAKNPKIRVLNNQQFLRVIPNHNHALRQISPESKYCKMVFADDLIFPRCIEEMVAIAEEHPSVGIVGAYGLDGSNVLWVGLPYPSTVIPGQEVCRRLFLDRLYVFGTATSLLQRADLIRSRDPFYREDNIHADCETCIDLLKTCDFGFVNQILTFTRPRQHSLSKMSSKINTVAAGRVHDLMTHGRHFLTETEFERCLRRELDEYYTYLGESSLRGRDKSFWDYHKKLLHEAGLGFSRAQLAKGMLAALYAAGSHPQRTLKRLLGSKADERQTFVREIAEHRLEERT
jgi:glycosyltransferase involved in cell wall biosynthesis